MTDGLIMWDAGADPPALELVDLAGEPVVDVAFGVVAGPPGAPGGTVTGTVGAPGVGGHRVVAWDTGGHLVHADPSDPAHTGAVAGVTTGATAAGDTATIVTAGLVTEPSWAWEPGAPVWCGEDGALTQTPPASGWVQRIGWAVTTVTVHVQGTGDPVILAD